MFARLFTARLRPAAFLAVGPVGFFLGFAIPFTLIHDGPGWPYVGIIAGLVFAVACGVPMFGLFALAEFFRKQKCPPSPPSVSKTVGIPLAIAGVLLLVVTLGVHLVFPFSMFMVPLLAADAGVGFAMTICLVHKLFGN